MIALVPHRSPRDVRRASKGLGLADALHGAHEREYAIRFATFAFAALLHAGLAVGATKLPVRREEALRISEVELAPPPPTAAPEPPPPPPPPPEPEVAPAAATPAASPVPPVARAGNVVTARSDAPSASPDAVDFVTDPDGKSFGSGVVARGGTLDRGTVATNVAPSRPPAVVRGPARPGPDAVTAPENLSRAARLDEPNPCAGFYPRSASADSGQVTLSLVVRPGGRLASAAVVSETPPGEGFGAAARACLADKTFAPALDRAGNAVTAALSLRVRFTR